MISTHTPDTLSRRTFLAALGAASAAAPALAADAPAAASATAAPSNMKRCSSAMG